MKVVASTVENEEESDEDKVYVLKSIADDLCQPQVGSGPGVIPLWFWKFSGTYSTFWNFGGNLEIFEILEVIISKVGGQL